MNMILILLNMLEILQRETHMDFLKILIMQYAHALNIINMIEMDFQHLYSEFMKLLI